MPKPLTSTAIRNLKPGSKRQEIPDAGLTGLYLIVQPSGVMSWQVRYRHGGTHRRLTLGRCSKGEEGTPNGLTLKEARTAAAAVLDAASLGRDPAGEKQAAKAKQADEADRNAFSTLLGQFDKRHLSKLKSGWQNKAALDAYALPVWKDRDVRTITRRDVIDLLDSILDDGKETTANRVRAYLSKFFAWCVERDVIEVSPVLGIKPPAKEKVRDRVLTDDEIRWFWGACEKAGYPWGALGKLLLLTGQRLGEVTGMTEAEIDGTVWHLTGDRTKNKRTHDVPLSKAVQDVIAALERPKGDDGYLMTTTGETPVSGYYKGRNNIAKHMTEIASEERGQPVDIPSWSWHDLRRTAATGMARLGIPVRVTEAVLNHVSGTGGGIVAVYQRHDYADEKRNALEAWARFVMCLLEGGADNVVRIEAGK